MQTTAQLAAWDRLKAAVARRTTDAIREGLRFIGGGKVSEESYWVRVSLLEEYERREGGDAVDAMMTELGM